MDEVSKLKALKSFILISGATLVTIVGFQNCGQFAALSPGEFASSGTYSLPNEQQKALSILSHSCKSCHIDQSLGNVAGLHDVNHMLSRGLVVAGQPDESPLLQAIEADRMPPSGPLNSEDKRTLKNWILLLGGRNPEAFDPELQDLSFTFTVSTDPLPFRSRLGKIESLLGSGMLSSSTVRLYENRLFLGDYNFASAIVPKHSWESTDMKAWVSAVEPVCASAEFKARYGAWPAGISAFVEDALGRTSGSVETNVAQEISALQISNQEKFELFCLSTLSSLEFITK